ncbi:MAG: hypothetical protein ACRDV9_13425 [Acidimicrobiia bacterium]
MTIPEAERRMAEQFFLDALKAVESDSIRAWARDIPRHREAWVSAAESHLRKTAGRGNRDAFTALIVCTAIGA